MRKRHVHGPRAGGGPDGASPRPHWPRVCGALGAALLSATLAAAAHAQLPTGEGPFAVAEQAAKENDLDTDHTPVPKETELWALLHGTEFGETKPVLDSVTRFDSDLFTVSFAHRNAGLAGGSACRREPVQGEDEPDAEFGARAAECRPQDGEATSRVPVLYRYSERGGEPVWEPVVLQNGDQPGYVGAVAWIDENQALIAGGTGTYPRRDLGWGERDQFGRTNDAADPADPARADPAGEARIWIYDRQSHDVTELDPSSLPEGGSDRAGMRGLTAAGCYFHPERLASPDAVELCFVGGLAQIWEWRDDGFSGKRVDSGSLDAELTDAQLFRYRVRDIEFNFRLDEPRAYAVTAGCCGEIEQREAPQVLIYEEEPASGPQRRWEVQTGTDCTGWPKAVCIDEVSGEADDAYKEVAAPRPDRPDSYYALVVPGSSSSSSFGTVSAAGGPERSVEPPSAGLGTSRLVAADGDVKATNNSESKSPDGQPDWILGELRSTRIEGLGARGLVVANTIKPPAASTLNASASYCCGTSSELTMRPTPDEVTSGWEPIDQEKFDTYVRSTHFLLPSYSANAVEIVGAEEDGWAVGDRGAILRLDPGASQSRTGAAEPKPPRLGSGSTKREPTYPSSSPRRDFRAGTVPPLGVETTTLDEPRMIPYGAVRGEIDQIVMSRDGSKGWAIGTAHSPAGTISTLHHFTTGGGWRECDPTGIKGLVAADPACNALAPLLDFRNVSGNQSTARIVAASRVPLENDDDPTNDDELEIVAITSDYTGPETSGRSMPAMLRYRDGRWAFEDPEAFAALQSTSQRMLGLGFTAPDDGWFANGPWLYRFDGNRWNQHPMKGHLNLDTRGMEGLVAAGERVYIFGKRRVGAAAFAGAFDTTRAAPMIIYRERGGEWTDGSGADGDGGGFDPAFSDPGTRHGGGVLSLSLAQRADGEYEGWAVGHFGAGAGPEGVNRAANPPADATLMRLEAGEGWRYFRSPGAFEDYLNTRFLFGALAARPDYRRQVTYPSEAAPDGAFIAQASPTNGTAHGRIFGFNSTRQRFEMLESGRPQAQHNTAIWPAAPHGSPTALAADGFGGFWAGVSPSLRDGFMYRWTARPPKPVFEEAPNPLGTRDNKFTSLKPGLDGSVWAASDSNAVYRHDPRLGWEEIRIPGWDPGRVVTRASRAEAIAVGPDDEALVVGEAGRIATVDEGRVSLDPAAGRSCALGQAPPCSTSRDLLAADIAPDGSAIVGGRRLSLLWRSAGEAFQAIAKPPIASSAAIEAISYPAPDRAYLATDLGRVFRGELIGGDWQWRVENENERGRLLSRAADGRILAINDVAVEESGRGYAVGEEGLVLERSTEGAWRRLPSTTELDLTSVELPATAGEGALVGGENGLILTLDGSDVAVARADDWEPLTGPVVGFAYLPGSTEGSVDAWAALGPSPEGGTDSRLLRHRSGPPDPLHLGSDSEPIPDTPPQTSGELTLAAFGKSDCDMPDQELCPEMTATTTSNELLGARVIDHLQQRRQEGAVDLAVLTGDATDSASLPGSSAGNYNRVKSVLAPSDTHLGGQLKHRRFAEAIVDELEEEGVATLGAVGGQDLSESVVCDTGRCHSQKALAPAGENLAWREAFGTYAAPWGDGSEQLADEGGEVTLEPAPGWDEGSVRVEDQRAKDPTGGDGAEVQAGEEINLGDPDGSGNTTQDVRITPKAGVPPPGDTKTEIGGANTHYAVDALRDGEPVARLVFVDTSMRSLQASDPLQQPAELTGQAAWLEQMICAEGKASSTGAKCTRQKDQAAIVVSNTPTYSYGPGALTHTATDATTFEALMLRHDVDLVISGALGYSGLYYTLAPGLHEPCPGGEHPHSPPKGKTPDCSVGPAGILTSQAGAPSPPELPSFIDDQGLTGSYPTLVAAGAGGKFGPDGYQGPDGAAGQWHGYSVARLQSDGDLVVEQRPILDWIGMDAARHVVRPRQKLPLRGYGRSPVSTTTEGRNVRAFHYEISNAAITHRYDLLTADPERPWAPLEDSAAGTSADGAESCGPYVCLDPEIATVDSQSGQVKAGSGKHPPTFAVAMLSVGEEVATYPLHFEPSPSFRFEAPTAPRPTPAIGAVAAPGSPTAPTTPQIPSVSFPQAPVPPALVPPPPAPPATPPQPPVPPPVPPADAGASALNLSFAPTGLVVAPTAAVIPPPAPPINPAPPGGARKEARQRQAATQKSGADSASGEGANEGSDNDLAQAPPGSSAEMTRRENPYTARERSRPGSSFTPLAAGEQRSAWSSGALYGGGLTLMAAALALGFTTLRPGSRRRQPEVPAPARSRLRG